MIKPGFRQIACAVVVLHFSVVEFGRFVPMVAALGLYLFLSQRTSWRGRKKAMAGAAVFAGWLVLFPPIVFQWADRFSIRTVPVLYGLYQDHETFARAERGEIVLGACMLRPFETVTFFRHPFDAYSSAKPWPYWATVTLIRLPFAVRNREEQDQGRVRVSMRSGDPMPLPAAPAEKYDPNPERNTELMDAARAGDYDRARRLISEGEDVNAQNIYGGTALYNAVVGGDAAMVALLLRAGAHPDTVISGWDSEDSVLIEAVRNEQAEIVKLLVQSGADVNYTGRYGVTALMCAKTPAIRQILLKAKSVNAASKVDHSRRTNQKQGQRTPKRK